FPHHENEIAQAEAATGGLFANYWVHNGLLTVNGEKMSKSLRNYVTISDFLKEHRDPDLLKIAFVNSHYRSPVDYSDGKIEEAGRSRQRIMIFMEKTERLFPKAGDREPVTGSRTVQRIREMTGGLEERFTRAMDDDFNTPVALSAIFEAVRLGNECLAGEGPDAGNVSMAAALRRLVRGFAEVLGLSLEPVSMEKEEAARIERLVAERENARERGRYDAADEIRRKLVEKGIVIEDTPEGTVWRKS
ncbi:MAG: cysteine--tRNA ligase, partial [Candidatus Omnitrophica bacterium]|nr:cysteine--tRNA ligase [Candidatus Omnitrophota bacterium]